MKILKFGGTSVATAESIKQVIAISNKSAKQDKVVVVVSALSDVTDILLQSGFKAEAKDQSYLENISALEERHIKTVKELISDSHQDEVIAEISSLFQQLASILEGIYLINEFSNKTKDKIASFGELLSSYIIAEAMKSQGINATRKNSQELIITDNSFTNAKVNYKITEKNISVYFNQNDFDINVLPGFVASTINGETTTIGRGGSDFTASILAKALGAKDLEIWTDVSGMYTANPKLVKQAKPIEHI